MSDQIKTTTRRLAGRDKAIMAGIAVAAFGFGFQFGLGLGVGVGGALMALCATLDRPERSAESV